MQQRVPAVYARQSVDKPDSISVESQIDFCKYELRGRAFKQYCDKGYSGKNTDRPQFQQLIRDIEQGFIHTVVVYKLDRISRSILDFSNLMEFFQKHDVQFVSSTEKFDTSTPMGRAMLNICIVFAQLERETIQKRVSDAYYSRSRKGLRMGGKPPFGFTLEPITIEGIHTKRLSLCPEEAPLVNQIFSMYCRPQTTYGDITRHFSQEGIIFRGKELSRPTLAQMLKNPVYVRADKQVYEFFKEYGTTIVNSKEDFTGVNGCYLYQGQETKENKLHNLKGQMLVLAPHEGIVPAEIWLQCRTKLLKNRKIYSSSKAIHTWLAGKIKCGNCGYALVSIHNSSGKHYLRCAKRLDNKSCDGCGKIPTAQAEQFVYLEMVKKMLEVRLYGIESILQKRSQQYGELHAQLDVVEQQIEALLSAICSPDTTLYSYINTKIQELDEKKQQIWEKMIETAPEQITSQQITQAGDIIENWRESSFEEKRAAVDILIHRVLATDQHTEIIWKI